MQAYSALHIKQIEERAGFVYIKGIASTPTTDRVGDVVNPMGARFKTPMPLLWQHKADKPVGRVTFAKPSKTGIPFEAEIPRITAPGLLKDRIDEAIQSLEYRLVAFTSIGFNPDLEHTKRLPSGGLQFDQWDWRELSLVTIPAQPEAVITSVKALGDGDTPAPLTQQVITAIKSLDQTQMAALGHKSGRSQDPSPGASGTKQQPALSGFSFSRSQRGNQVKTMQELRDERTQKAARMRELLDLCKSEDRDMGDDEAVEFDGLETEVKSLDSEIRQKRFDVLNSSTATPVDGKSTEGASRSRGGPTIHIKSSDADESFKGQNYTRMVIAKALAHLEGGGTSASGIAQQRWGKTNPTLVRLMKANEVAGGGTGAGEWGHELAQADTRYTGDFLTLLQSATVFDKLPLKQVPSNVIVKGQDGAGTGYWVAESKAIPATTVDFMSVELTELEVGALAVVSNRLLRNSSPAAEALITDALVEAQRQRVDTTFLSAAAAVAGVSPAGILNGLTGIAASGVDSDAFRADLLSAMAPFFAAKNAGGTYLVMRPELAEAMALMVNALGQSVFAGLSAEGGTLRNRPVVTGDNVPSGAIIVIKPSDVWRIGDSGVRTSISRDAMIEQSTAPTGATDTPVAASQFMTSMFQAESTAIKVVRTINYAKRRASAVSFITGANYGGVAA